MIVRPNRWLEGWETLVTALTIFAALEIPLRLSLDYTLPLWLQVMDMILTVIFCADVVVHFNTATVIDRSMVTDRRKVARRYLRGWFVVDFLAAVPFYQIFEALLLSSAGLLRAVKMLRLLRMLRLARLAQSMHDSRLHFFMHPSVVRLLFFVFWVGMSSHWLACAWLALEVDPSSANEVDRYIQALYWSVTTLTTVGYGDITPSTNAQTLFTMATMFLGVGVYGYVIGNVATLLTNLDVEREQHVKRMDRVNAFLRSRSVPRRLQERVRSYYSYVWETRTGYVDYDVLMDLPPSLRSEIAMHLNKEVIKRVPLFEQANENFIRQAVGNLQPLLLTPGDYVFHQGDQGHEMYFVSRGELEVIDPKAHQVLATIGSGDFFGEVSLLMDEPRTASIRAVTYCELFKLDQDSFKRILSDFPEFDHHIRKVAQQRFRQGSKDD